MNDFTLREIKKGLADKHHLYFLRHPEVGYQIMRICPIRLAFDHVTQTYCASVEAGTTLLHSRHVNACHAVAACWVQYEEIACKNHAGFAVGDRVQFHLKGAKDYNEYSDYPILPEMRFEITKINVRASKIYLWCKEKRLGLALTRQQAGLFLIKVNANG